MKPNKIIMFEGLFGIFFRWLWRGLVKDIAKQYPDLKVERRHWTSKEMINDPCAIVIGHSFGAVAANTLTYKCRLLVTLDCRNGFTSEYKTHLKNAKDGFHLNFYQQHSGLPGYPIDGAINEVVKASHLGIVKHPIVYKSVMSEIERVMK